MKRAQLSRAVVAPVARALRQLGADVSELDGGGLAVDSSVSDALMDRAAAIIGEDVGPRVARLIPLGALGPVDYALSTSATVHEGLTRLSRYYGVATDRVALSVLSGDVEGIELARRPQMPQSRHWIEFSLALILGRICAAAGESIPAVGVSFRHEAPNAPTEHAALFGAPVMFGASCDRLIFALGTLTRPFQTAAPFLGEMLRKKLDEIETTANGDPLLRRVREEVAASLIDENFGIDSVARRLAMSRRSLQRHLRELDSSFKDIVDAMRRERARDLVEAGVSTTAIADELGFADASAFFRAFRRWTGETPGARKPRAPR